MDAKEKKRLRDRKYYQDNQETIRAAQRQYYWDNRDKVLAGQKKRGSKYYWANRDKILADGRRKWRENDDYAIRRAKVQAGVWERRRLRTFEVLGGSVCVRCEFSDWRALQIDHINGGGHKHMRSFSNQVKYYEYVVENKKEFQVLCANCNRLKVHENREVRQRASAL